MLNPHLALEMLKINFHLHLIFLFVTATIVCLNKEVARASLSSSQSSSQSPNWRDTDVNEQGDQARVLLGMEKLPQDCQAPRCSASSPTWLSGERPGSCLCLSPACNLMLEQDLGESFITLFHPTCFHFGGTHQIWGWAGWLK